MMDRRLGLGSSVLVAVLLSACAHAAEGGAPALPARSAGAASEALAASCQEAGPAADVLARFHAAVEETIVPRLDEEATPSLTRDVARLAEQYLVPARVLLRERASWRLRCLPDAHLPSFAGWETEAMSTDEITEITKALEYDDRGGMGGMLVSGAWDPVSAARTWPNVMLGRSLTPSGMGKVAYLRSFSPLEAAAVDRNVDRPVVALAAAREVFVVRLRNDPRGYYVPERIEWHRKYPHPAKVAARRTTPESAPAQAP
jgi:hypothetical protein